MLPARDWRHRIADMLDAAAAIRRTTEGLSYQQFCTDTTASAVICWNLMIIGEAAQRLPGELRTRAPSIPWTSIIAVRNTLVHRYPEIDSQIVWETAMRDVPALVPLLQELLAGAE